MRDISTVSKFTMKEMLKRKSFIISTIILMIVIILGFNLPNIIRAISRNNSIELGSKIIISDNENIFEDKLEKLDQDELSYKTEIAKNSVDEIKEKINNNEIDAGIIIEKQDNKITFRYIVDDTTGTMPDDLKQLTPEFEINVEQTKEVKGNTMVITVISVLLFYAIYFCAYQVSSSITTEKTSKIIETLVTSTSPRTIVLGKTI